MCKLIMTLSKSDNFYKYRHSWYLLLFHLPPKKATYAKKCYKKYDMISKHHLLPKICILSKKNLVLQTFCQKDVECIMLTQLTYLFPYFTSICTEIRSKYYMEKERKSSVFSK